MIVGTMQARIVMVLLAPQSTPNAIDLRIGTGYNQT